MTIEREEIFASIDQHRAELRELGVRKLQLFGSAARKEQAKASDLDFLVELAENSFDSYMDVKFFLEDLFEYPVDLVLVDSVKPLLRERILEEAIDAPGF